MARERIPLGDEGINRSAERLDVLLGSRASALPPSAGGDMFSKIVLYFGDGSNAQFFDVNDTGLAASIAAVTGTDTIAIPPAADATFTSAITIPANTAVQGTGTQTTFISAKVTMSSNSFLRDVTVLISANSGANLTGVAGPSDTGTTAYMNTVSIQITQAGAGDAYGIEMGGGDLFVRSSFMSGTSTGGTGNGIKSGAGDIYIEEGSAVQGSSAAISGTNTYSIDSDKFISLHDTSNTNYNWIFTPDATGLAAAITASATGDVIFGPHGTSIALTSGITIPANVSLENMLLTFSGFSGTAITMSNDSNFKDSTVTYDGSGQANATGLTASGVSDANISNVNLIISGASGTMSGFVLDGSSATNRISVNSIFANVTGGTATVGIQLTDNIDGIDIRTSVAGGSSTNYGIQFVSTDATTVPTIISGRANATGTSSHAVHVNANKYARLLDFWLGSLPNNPAATVDVYITTGATLELSGCRYSTITEDGTLVYLQGDRSAYSVEDFHAEDIEDSQETRHVPTPTRGDLIIGDSNPYWEPLAVGGAGTILKTDGTDVLWTTGVTIDGNQRMTIAVATTTTEALILQTTDDNTTKNLFETWASDNTPSSVFTSAGNLELPTTTSTVGQIIQGGNRFIHSYGTDNLFVGEDSGNFTLTVANATRNVGIGVRALDALTTGGANMAIGYQALTANTTGAANLAIGSFAMAANTEGVQNVALGGGALENNTTGQANMAIGASALIANLTGNGNVAIGKESMKTNESGAANIAIGSFSLETLLNQNFNVAVGYTALQKATSKNNTAIGSAAGALITSGQHNICMGYQAGNVITTGSSNIIIGYDIDPSAAGADNEINIGGVYKGNVSTPVFTLPVAGTIGDGGTTNYIDFTATGDVKFVGGAGLAYGSMYTNADIAVVATSATWVELDAAQAWTTGKVHNCSFADPEITVTNAGTYLITYGLTLSSSIANKHVETGIMIDSNTTDGPAHGSAGVQNEGRSHAELLAVEKAVSGKAIIQLAASKTISIAVRNVDAANPTVTVAHGNLVIIQIAGVSA